MIFDLAALGSSEPKVTTGTSPTATLRAVPMGPARSAIAAVAERWQRMTDPYTVRCTCPAWIIAEACRIAG